MAARMDRFWLLLIPALAQIGTWSAAAEAKTWASGTFVYADLCMEGGERVGRRITLRRSPNGNALIYETGLADPLRIESIAFEDETRSVSFVLETDRGPVTFRGRIESQTLTGVFEDAEGAHDVRLPRVLRSQADQPCHGEASGGSQRR